MVDTVQTPTPEVAAPVVETSQSATTAPAPVVGAQPQAPSVPSPVVEGTQPAPIVEETVAIDEQTAPALTQRLGAKEEFNVSGGMNNPIVKDSTGKPLPLVASDGYANEVATVTAEKERYQMNARANEADVLAVKRARGERVGNTLDHSQTRGGVEQQSAFVRQQAEYA